MKATNLRQGAPSTKVIEPVENADSNFVTDAKGRRLLLRDLTFLQELDLIRMVGQPDCENRLYMRFVTIAAQVAEIDGEPCDFPMSPVQVRAMLQEVGHEGTNAVMLARVPQLFADDGEAKKVSDAEATAKN